MGSRYDANLQYNISIDIDIDDHHQNHDDDHRKNYDDDHQNNDCFHPHLGFHYLYRSSEQQ